MFEMTKRFPGVLANDHITFEVEAGEIHALLGENGAGKTTLMNILYGIHQPDHGELYVFEEKVKIRSPRDALQLGIGMVHQHFMLAAQLTVIENIVLGRKTPRWPLLDLPEAKTEVGSLSKQYHFNLDLDAKVWQLSVGMQQRVEIVKALFREARVLVLDEPTSVLTPQETEELMVILKGLAAKGLSIIFISHKLEEVMRLCDRITVLRHGKGVATVRTEEVSKESLARMMVGREVLFRTERFPPSSRKVLLDVENLSATSNRGLRALHQVSFQIMEGEIFGIVGVDGNGQSELAEVIAGLRTPQRGKITLNGIDATPVDALGKRQMGVGYVPEDRQKRGLVLRFSAWENLILKNPASPAFTFHGAYFKFADIKKGARAVVEQFDIRGPGLEAPVIHYSGGNQQKIVLAREFGLNPILLIAAQPTRGLDVGATEFVHHRLIQFAREGNAVLLISTELEEIFSLSHRFAVIYEGELVGLLENREPIDIEEIGLMMAGSKRRTGG